MSIIKKLENNLINQIAAGEVIERPASVIKELIENSIDAKSTKIEIEIKESGFSLIKIIDNGKGMDKDDAKLCIERHTTSKIKDADDLFKIKTLGFRGEALASIASISDLKLITKQVNSKTAIQINVEAGRIYQEKELGWQDGTTIEVKELFFNVPARKKFLKNMRLEFQHIVDVVSRYALIHPDIFFRLKHNQKDIFIAPSTTDWQGSIINIYGKDIAKDLLSVNYFDETYKISGFVSKPSLTRADKGHQSIYVNKRYIKNSIITNGIYDAYHTLLFNNRHPIIILNIEINPNLIDVNVHPAKKEIRINKESEMREIINIAIKDALNKESLIPKDTDKQTRILIDDIKLQKEQTKKKYYSIPESKQQELNQNTNYQTAYLKQLEENNKERYDSEINTLSNEEYILSNEEHTVSNEKLELNIKNNNTCEHKNDVTSEYKDNNILKNIDNDILKKKDNAISGHKNNQTSDSTSEIVHNDIEDERFKYITEINKTENTDKLEIIPNSDDVNNVANINNAEEINAANSSNDKLEDTNNIKKDIDNVELPKDKLRIIGQLHNCYIIIEDFEGMMIIDQHAAEERVNYEKLMLMYSAKKLESQHLLEPLHFELNPNDSIALENNISTFKNIGFDIDIFGNNSFILRSVPLLLNKLQNKQSLIDLLDEVKSLKNLEEKMLIQKACKASVKQGDELTHFEISKLIANLKKTETPYTCPHGRPTMIKMTKSELERKFKRTG